MSTSNNKIVGKSVKHIFHFVLVLALLISSGYIVIYYWSVTGRSALQVLPPALLIYLILYILGQLIKRYVKKVIKWYDWIYYPGLLAILLPLLDAFAEKEWIFPVTKYGSLFLFIPPLIELFELILKGKKAK